MGADSKDNKEGKLYNMTKNVINKGKIFGKNKRNWAEAIIYTIIVIVVVLSIPFTKLVETITLLVLVPVVFGTNLIGIKHRSLSEIIIAEINFRNNRRRLHLRGPEYVRKNYKSTYTESEDESLAEHHYKLIKQRIDEFVEKYGAEEDSFNA